MTVEQNLKNLVADRATGEANLRAQGLEDISGIGFSEIADKIREIEGDFNTGTIVDDGETLTKDVPKASISHTYLKSVSGRTVKDEENTKLIDTKFIGVQSKGVNFIDLETALNDWRETYEKDGDTYVLKSITRSFSYPYIFTNTPDIYTLSVSEAFAEGITSPRIDLGYLERAGSTFQLVGSLTFGRSTTLTTTAKINALRFNYSAFTAGWSITIKELRLNKGARDLGYTPYLNEVTEFPESVIDAQTGRGIEGYTDTVDFENRKRTLNTKSLKLADVSGYESRQFAVNNLDGNRFISSEGLVGFLSRAVNDFVLSRVNLLLCNVLPATTNWQGRELGIILQRMTNGQHYMSFSIPIDWIGLDSSSTQSEISAATRKWLIDNDATLTYALETPIEEDIDLGDFEPLIKVQAGGTLELITDTGLVAPNTIHYQVTGVDVRPEIPKE